MKHKKSFVFFCLIICLFAVVNVYAADANDTCEIQSSDVISVCADNKLSTSEGTFTDLANEIANSKGMLNLTRNYAYFDGDEDYKNGIGIDGEIIINGNGFQIDAKNMAGFFTVNSDNVCLKNIRFANGCAPDSETSSVFWHGLYGTLDNCSFSGCTSLQGGAVYWNGYGGEMLNCSFKECFGDDGGAVYWYGSYGKLSGCSFKDCFGENGGAVYWMRDWGVLSDCSFTNCSGSKGYSCGGAVYWSLNAISGVLTGCRFTDCFASSGGGALYWYASKGTLSNSTFLRCSALEDGGAVYWSKDYGNMDRCNFRNCSVLNKYSHGGAVYWNGMEGNMSCCGFADCSSLEEGGTIYWYGYKGTLNNCVFVKSFTSDNGGAVCWRGQNGEVEKCNFTDCGVSFSHDSYGGGAVYWGNSNGRLSGCAFINCSAFNNGGAVYWNGNDGNLSDSDFIGCYSIEGEIVWGITPTDCKFLKRAFIALPSITVNYGDDATITAYLDSDVEGDVIFTVNDRVAKVKIINGVANYTVGGLAGGAYCVSAYYAGDDAYGEETIKSMMYVQLKTFLTAQPVTAEYKSGECLTAYLKDDQGKALADCDVEVKIRDLITNLITDSEGKVCLLVSDLSPDNYTALISFRGNEIYLNSSTSANIVINKMATEITAANVNTVYNGGKYLVARLSDNQNHPLTDFSMEITLNGKIYVQTTDANGQIRISTDGLVPVKTYIASVIFKGNANYDGAASSVKVTVTKATPKLTASKKTFKRTVKIKKYTVILKTNQNVAMKNAWITLKVNKKTYKVKTNAKGQGLFKITNLNKKGTFTAVVKYAGNSYYNSQNAKPKIIVR